VGNEVPDAVLGDPALRQSSELVGNASSSQKGERDSGARARRKRQGGRRCTARSRVAEKGIGIPVERQAQVLEALAQVTARSRVDTEAPGLGLRDQRAEACARRRQGWGGKSERRRGKR